MADLWTRFQRDLTLNWKKTAALGVLLLFGCCFWIPMLTRAVAPRRAAASAVSTPTAAMNPETTPSTVAPNSLAATNSDAFWSTLSKSLESDPLFQPVEILPTVRDPFTPEEGQTPLPVLFAVDSETETVNKVVVADEADPQGLELNSTMIGRTRRVAIINGQLCQVDRELLVNGHRFRLAAIESHRVVLTSGNKNYELTLVRPQLADVLNRERAVDLSLPRAP
jgi:hypothetical protein